MTRQRSTRPSVKIAANINGTDQNVDEAVSDEESSFFRKLRRRSSAVILDLFRKRTTSEFQNRRHSFVHGVEQEENKRSVYSRRKSIPAYLGNRKIEGKRLINFIQGYKISNGSSPDKPHLSVKAMLSKSYSEDGRVKVNSIFLTAKSSLRPV